MSKDSSIKVFAENTSGTRPANAIPVWIDNISAIGGGGGNPEVESYVTTNSGKIDDVCSTVQTNSASFDTFYIYPGKTTNKEVSENSGKNMKLYNSANNSYLDYAGKITYSNYSIFNFKGISGTQDNYNTLQHLRVRVYPNATSACSVYQTTSVDLLNSNSTVNYAQTAYYDSNGNSLAQTNSTLTALNQFVQTNSASWGGGGSTGTSIPLRTSLQSSDEYGSQNTNYYLSSDGSTFVFTAYDEGWAPADLIINGNNYSWSYNNGRWEIQHSIYGQESVGLGMAVGVQYSGQDIIPNIPVDKVSTALNKVEVSNNNGSITGNITLYDQWNFSLITSSFTGSWTGYIPTSYNGNTVSYYRVDAGAEYYGNDYSYTIDIYSEAKSNINSADVFPSTNNLSQGNTYKLCWNTNYGGLYWDNSI